MLPSNLPATLLPNLLLPPNLPFLLARTDSDSDSDSDSEPDPDPDPNLSLDSNAFHQPTHSRRGDEHHLDTVRSEDASDELECHFLVRVGGGVFPGLDQVVFVLRKERHGVERSGFGAGRG